MRAQLTSHPSATNESGEQPVLEVSNLSVEFLQGKRWVRVVDDVTFDVRAGETVGVVGESGSGKSVTSLAIMSLLTKGNGRIVSGSVRLGGREILGLTERELAGVRGNQIAMIFQEPMTSLNPAFTIGEQISEVVRKHRGLDRAGAKAIAARCLDLVGIPSAERQLAKYPHEFSGGMRQRAMIAMAISCEPDVIIADEPTTALDVTTQAQILDLLKSMQQDLGVGMVFITHNMGVVADICDRVAVMYAGQVVEAASVFELMSRPRHPYTEGLLAAVPPLERRVEILPSIPGSPPDPRNFPAHCRFADRCPYVTPDCLVAPIPLLPAGAHRTSRCIRLMELELRGVS